MRPATPLSVLFFAAFALLLLSSLSTPVVKGIPLSTYNGVTFGVWGFCKGNACSTIGVGYSIASLNQISGNDFSLPIGLRHSVSFILIAHPVAAFMGLISLGLAISAHFHSPSHSPRFLLGLFIWTIPTIIASLLAFLVDILLFIPHNSWGSWIVLAATIILFISSVMTCFMRRTLVSRKARRKRIAENAEMSGQNYYESRAAEAASLPKAESPPPLSGGSISPLNPEKPGFATFESQQPDDRILLNSNTSQRGVPRETSPNSGYGPRAMPPPNRDQYGNPLPNDIGREAPLRQQPSNTSLQSTPSNRSNRGPVPPMPPFYAGQGRGGYPPSGPRGRGGYPPRGGMMRGGMPSQGMRGPPPPGYGGRGRGGPPGMMGRGGLPPNMMGRGGPPGPGYGQDRFYNGLAARGDPYTGPPPRSMPIPMNPVPVGQAVEMDATQGVPSPAQSRPGSSGPGINELPGIAGTMERRPSEPARTMSPTSEYSHPHSPEPYVPPRAQWAQPSQRMMEMPPLPNNRALSPIEASPTSPPRNEATAGYVEDVDPVFAAPVQPIPASLMPAAPPNRYGQFPSGSNLPGPNIAVSNSNPTMTKFLNPTETTLGDPNNPSGSQLQYSNSSESLPDSQRSPAASDASHFTSVSQRGVNPDWRPPPGQGGRPDPRQRQNDVLLNSNPDFSLPGAGPPGRGARGGYMGSRGGISMGPPRGGMGLGSASAGGRYPGAF